MSTECDLEVEDLRVVGTGSGPWRVLSGGGGWSHVGKMRFI